MRIDSDGKSFIGGISLAASLSDGNIFDKNNSAAQGAVLGRGSGSAVAQFASYEAGPVAQFNYMGGDGTVCEFYRSGTSKGSITVNSSGTTYNTSSDYRLKENVVDLDGAIDRLNQLQVRRFNFIADPDRTVDGFLAHEAQAVVPECVTGTKDQVEVWKEGEELPDGVSVGDNKLDEDGNTIPVYQGIDQSKLVPLLTAALQEALAKIETLEQRLTDAGL
jgi:hypothetical protein